MEPLVNAIASAPWALRELCQVIGYGALVAAVSTVVTWAAEQAASTGDPERGE